jgi:hypothetical protein
VSLGGEKCEQKTWKALKVKLMIGLVIEHASFLLSFLPSWSPLAYNLYQWFFLRQILVICVSQVKIWQLLLIFWKFFANFSVTKFGRKKKKKTLMCCTLLICAQSQD